MSNQKPLLSLKKTFFYNFFPSKAEEEACKLNNTPYVVTREIIEIRDIYPPPKIDLINPWQIKKKITRDEVITLEYILRYWTLDEAKSMVNGCDVPVGVWDVTEENIPKKYDARSVCLRKLYGDYFYLSCIKLFKSRGLSIGDEIGLYWDPRSSSLMFKLLYQKRFSVLELLNSLLITTSNLFSRTTSDEEYLAIKKMYVFSIVDGFVEIIESLMDMIKFIAKEPSAGLFYVQQHTYTAVPLHTADSIQRILSSWSATEKWIYKKTKFKFSYSERNADYISNVFRSTKEKASSFKWPRMDSIESKPAKNDKPSVTCSNDDTTLEADAISCTEVNNDKTLLFSSQTDNMLQDVCVQVNEGMSRDQILS
ncbi:hypothetical protein H5410_028711 [Solanum commersonii]|uniref:Uncharacterized protein n=1 Tax=Solanum commersonii TaxID=4109 RepID=A0A9J5Z2P5_SOLCO|nr:hypothetical protein H5410_028711 [Solanum commersonii]